MFIIFYMLQKWYNCICTKQQKYSSEIIYKEYSMHMNFRFSTKYLIVLSPSWFCGFSVTFCSSAMFHKILLLKRRWFQSFVDDSIVGKCSGLSTVLCAMNEVLSDTKTISTLIEFAFYWGVQPEASIAGGLLRKKIQRTTNISNGWTHCHT